MLKRLYDRVIALAGHRHAAWFLAAVAFAEASFFPIPPDPLLIAMGLARPRRVWLYALICTTASVAGGALGYLIGFALFDRLAQPIIHLYHMEHAFQTFQDKFARYGLYVILIKGLTPIPYKIVTIAAGAAKFNFWEFMGASLITRGGRFFLVGAIMRIFGEAARDFIEKRLMLVTSLLAVGVIGGFLILLYV
ncbi:DedA family protein [Acidisoma cellulosilytica]|uniref:DedA family protein n=1 Tax=Acidisoma cellulosilyticum TaxID=2802395 RepID=A0A963Z5K7_9PROT|nr:YqaA family protein [Acidisoma cellulosilyticum]MCB8883249.1 DedA family protein [Acidisoma cellulosilyticum]